jgi:hypothetical protein
MRSDKAVFRRNPNIVRRDIGEETVLVPVLKTSKEMNCIYTLNKSAARVWDLLDGKTDLSEIKTRILREFDTTDEEVDKELELLIKDLDEAEAILTEGIS